jgi:hypothetical protein
MKESSTLAIVTVMATALAGAAIAGEGTKTTPATGTTVSGSFDTLDSNKDGRISMPEASADPKLVESFSTADRNGDGYLDNSEYDGRSRSQSTDEPAPRQ